MDTLAYDDFYNYFSPLLTKIGSIKGKKSKRMNYQNIQDKCKCHKICKTNLVDKFVQKTLKFQTGLSVKG